MRTPSRLASLSFRDGEVVGANVDRRVSTCKRQLLHGVVDACTWDELTLRLAPEAMTPSWWRLRSAVGGRELALEVMRTASRDTEPETVRTALGDATYHLTDAGEHLLRGAELRPDEVAVVHWLRRGATTQGLLTKAGCGPRGARFAWVLSLLRAAAPRRGGSFPLLLRKRRELRADASPRSLLDLPDEASNDEARRALRKLVRELHPDRFGASAPPPVRRASGEIVTALVRAEASVSRQRTK